MIIEAPADIGQVSWNRSAADNASLADRWEAEAAKLRALGHAPVTPITEIAVFEMKKMVAAATPLVVHDPALSAAGQEHWDLRNRYRSAIIALEKLQRQMAYRANDAIHRLLGLPANWNVELPKEIPDTRSDASAQDLRREIARVGPLVVQVETLRDALDLALHADQREPAELHYQMLMKLFARHEELERLATRNAQLQAERANVLQDRINELEGRLTRLSQVRKKGKKR
jgi:hypothetical protein